MKRTNRSGIGVALLLPLAVLLWARPASAEDLRQKWYVGGNISFLSTIDSVRNNSSIIFTNQLGDDGIPFTGDPNELQGCGQFGSAGFSTDPFCDPRPDDLLARDDEIEEDFRIDLTAGYGLTSWLSVQFDASYFRGSVGPLDVFTRAVVPTASSPFNPSDISQLSDIENSNPIIVGDLTEIPVSISAIIRFRKDSVLNPYLGIGVGYIFTEMDVSDQTRALNQRLASLRIRGIGNQFGQEVAIDPALGTLKGEGRLPLTTPLTVEISDAFEWHLNAGTEYFFNDRFSLIFDVRYTVADQDIDLSLGGNQQVDFFVFPEALFRPDGSLKIFDPGPNAPNPLCSEVPDPTNAAGCFDFVTDPVTGARTKVPRANPTLHVNPTDQQAGGVQICPANQDFDGDGQKDVCFKKGATSPSGAREPTELLVVQGGKIDLTAFSVAIGARFHF